MTRIAVRSLLVVVTLFAMTAPALAGRDANRSRPRSKPAEPALYAGHFGLRVGSVGSGEYADLVDVEGGLTGAMYYDFGGSSTLVAGLSAEFVSVLPESARERKLLLAGLLNLKWGYFTGKSGLQFRPWGAVGYGFIDQAWRNQSMYLVVASVGGEFLIRLSPNSALTLDFGMLWSPYGRVEGISSGPAEFRPQVRLGLLL